MYVDDILLACESIDVLINIKQSLSERYQMKDLGPLTYFLGINVVQNKDKIFVHQGTYSKAILKKFNFDNCNPVLTPIDANTVFEKASEDSDLFDATLYQSAIGSLLYLCTKTRPDLTFSVCHLAKFCQNPTQNHWTGVKRIFRYLKGTLDLGISYDRSNLNSCIGYSDSDWAGDRDDRKSTSGYCFIMGSGLLSWKSNKQTCVALSTAEAEYVALSSAAQEAIWLKLLLHDLNFSHNSPMVIMEDNQACICFTKNPKDHGKN